jgi:hypothetical protein
MWVLEEKDDEPPKIIKKEITYVPGLYKIFDEILGKFVPMQILISTYFI